MVNRYDELRARVAAATRPLRRKVFPRRFKESYVNDILTRRKHSIYLEIGVRDGESFRLAAADWRIGIDPAPAAGLFPIQSSERFYEMTSDEFFGRTAATVLEPRSIAVALIDGLHTFEQALRDFENLEPFMCDDGLIVLDDMNPRSAIRASTQPTGGAWNGDVWKLGPYLQHARPDLQFATVDADEGVGLIGGFSSGDGPSRAQRLDVDHFKSFEYETLESDRQRLLNLVKRRKAHELIPATRTDDTT